MNNRPEGYFNTGENDTHYPECENQPADKKCICPEIEERQEAIVSYASEVDGVIRKAINL